jgi:hypothetical protein
VVGGEPETKLVSTPSGVDFTVSAHRLLTAFREGPTASCIDGGCTDGGVSVPPAATVYRESVKRGIITDEFWLTDWSWRLRHSESALTGLNVLLRRVLGPRWREALGGSIE